MIEINNICVIVIVVIIMKFDTKGNKYLQVQRRWQSSVGNSENIVTGTGTVTTTNINNDNIMLLQELFCEACSTLYNDILNAIDHQTVRPFF